MLFLHSYFFRPPRENVSTQEGQDSRLHIHLHSIVAGRLHFPCTAWKNVHKRMVHLYNETHYFEGKSSLELNEMLQIKNIVKKHAAILIDAI